MRFGVRTAARAITALLATGALTLLALLTLSSTAHAADSDPGGDDTPITDLLDDLTGPLTKPVTDPLRPVTDPVERSIAPVTRPVVKAVVGEPGERSTPQGPTRTPTERPPGGGHHGTDVQPGPARSAQATQPRPSAPAPGPDRAAPTTGSVTLADLDWPRTPPAPVAPTGPRSPDHAPDAPSVPAGASSFVQSLPFATIWVTRAGPDDDGVVVRPPPRDTTHHSQYVTQPDVPPG